jgi:hypothetical protein
MRPAILSSRRLCAGFAFALSFGAVPAAAQEVKWSAAEAEKGMAEFTKCMVAKHARRAALERFLRQLPAGEAFNRVGQSLADPDCLPYSLGQVTMHFQADLFRQSLYTALYQRDYGRLGPLDVKPVPALVVASEFDAPSAEIPNTVLFTRIVGDCVAREDSAAVHALLVSKIRSKEEDVALQRVMPAVQKCLPAGRQVRFSRSMLRGYVAEALYKLRKAAAAPAPAARPAG